MTKSILGAQRLLIASCILIYGCSKSQSDSGLQQSGVSNRLPVATFTLDPSKSPFYGDSVFYVQGDEVSAYIFRPQNQLGSGTYVSWPAGLSMDPHTGVIDVSKSEPGSLYNVGFVSSLTGDTAYRQITVPGVAYNDGIYYVNGADSVLQPFYYAGSSSSGAGSGSTGSSNGFVGLNGVFDEPGPSGLRANDQGLNVNPANGVINLRNSLQQGLFGPNPQNGDMRQIDIYYRVNDNSIMSLQRTAVIVHFYNTIGDVPTSLMNLVQSGQGQKIVDGGATTVQSGAISGGIINTTSTGTPVATTGQVARPPHIVLVNKGH